MKPLTRKQRAFYKYLQDFYAEHGRMPPYAVMEAAFDYPSPNSVTQNLQALEKKGWLVKLERGYALAETGAACCPHCGQQLEDAA
ncbi:MAG TPA: hypothetical protein VKP65_20070 [Rhodothermales bacterium]|nr:hypothetical protein [Rhodothermales bacterium]